jgi:gamma-glutamyltranspeptidase/glutathione hydrolase
MRVTTRLCLLSCVAATIACVPRDSGAAPNAPSYTGAAVATAAPLASDVGLDVLRRGGNAFDAAVAIGFALAVVHPQAGNIGGGGFAVVRDGAIGEIRSLDFRETAPLAAYRDMYLDDTGAVIEDLSLVGAKAAGTPGTVAGLHALWEAYGSLPWKDLVMPAVHLADTGFILDQPLAQHLREYRQSLSQYKETAEVFFGDNPEPRAGDRLVQNDLAKTLRGIAETGPDEFYKGETARKIVWCMEKHGGLITHDDLANYRAVWRKPIHFRFDGYDVYSMPPPSSGGIIVGQILKLLEPFELDADGFDSPENIHLFCEASRLAFADRATHLGDPDFYDIPAGLLDSAYLARRRTLIDRYDAGNSAEITAGRPGRHESDQTTHYSVCDAAGNMVAVTYTLNSNYGCKLVVEGAGFLLNNEMDDFSVKPGVPNIYGLIGGEANSIAPGKHMLSSMSPTLVLKDGRPRAILGTGGGSKIITMVAQAIINLTRFKLDAAEICAQPRFHHQWLPDRLYIEENSFSDDVIDRLDALGHNVQERSRYGDLQIIVIDDEGRMIPASDPRGRGVSTGY